MFAAGIVVPLLAVLVEEILFRPVLITWLRGRLTRTSWVAVSSAALWTLAHVPSNSASMLVGLFVTGLVLAGLYVWSGSNVVGYVLHAFAGGGSGGAVIMFVLCLVLGAAGWLIERRTARHPAPDVARSRGSRPSATPIRDAMLRKYRHEKGSC